MIRNKPILISISMLLFGAMALGDTKFFCLEQEELVECSEIEREELKEAAEGHDWIKLLLLDGNGYLSGQALAQLQCVTDFHVLDVKQHVSALNRGQVALFLMYCCLKIPFANLILNM